jgi:deoxyribose-phosphate aldolase
MNNSEYLIHQIEMEMKSTEIDPDELIACLDLTRLHSDDDERTITLLCEKAALHNVAAVCIYPAFVAQAKTLLHASEVQVATVANFPSGTQKIKTVLASIENCLKEGVDELDILIPYQAYLEDGDARLITNFVKECRKLLPNQCMKIILESGAIQDKQLLENAALASLEGGADFLKTSSGKVAQGASLAAAIVIFGALQRFDDVTRGFKASGGVRDYQQAKMYYLLAQMMMGDSWPNQNTFRLGASGLLDDLLKSDKIL